MKTLRKNPFIRLVGCLYRYSLNENWNNQIITIVAEENTDALNGKRPFEERVFARFDTLDSAMRDTDSRLENVDSRLGRLETRADDTNSRLQKLEVRAYDTKPIWEQALKEIVDTRRDLSKRLGRIEAVVFETRADLRDVEDHLEKDVEDRLQKIDGKLIQ